jgi:two-component system NtrC family sensor kinase
MVLDTNYRIVWINEAARRASGLTREEALGRYCFQVSHQQINPCTDPKAKRPMRDTLSTGLAAHAIHEHRTADGQTSYCDISTFPLFNRAGQVVEVVEVIRDITVDLNEKLEQRTRTLKDNFARAIQEDKLIALGKMVASVAHEVNNPIASIINFAMLILESLRMGSARPDQMAKFEKYLELTVREAQRCGKIVSNLLLGCDPFCEMPDAARLNFLRYQRITAACVILKQSCGRMKHVDVSSRTATKRSISQIRLDAH